MSRGRAALEKRLRILEAKLVGGSIVLTFSDGTTREIPARGDYLLKLCSSLGKTDELSATEREHIDWICESTRAEEPGGGRMTELIRCMMEGPLESPSTLESEPSNAASSGTESGVRQLAGTSVD